MKRALSKHMLMLGGLKRMELQANEIGQKAAESAGIRSEIRAKATEIYTEHRSPYIRKRLERLFSVLGGLDDLDRQEERQAAILQRILNKLQDSDLVDQFGRGMHRRMRKILQETESESTSIAEQWRGTHWFLLRIGTLHVAILGRPLRVQSVKGRVLIRSKSTRLRTFPEGDHWANSSNLKLAIFATEADGNRERVAFYCNEMTLLPPVFEPHELTAVPHTDFSGRMKYAGRTVYLWKPSRAMPAIR